MKCNKQVTRCLDRGCRRRRKLFVDTTYQYYVGYISLRRRIIIGKTNVALIFVYLLFLLCSCFAWPFPRRRVAASNHFLPNVIFCLCIFPENNVMRPERFKGITLSLAIGAVVNAEHVNETWQSNDMTLSLFSMYIFMVIAHQYYILYVM